MDLTVKSLLSLFPDRKLLLPLQGNRSDWPYHIAMCNPQFKDIWNRLTYSNMYSALSMIYNMNVSWWNEPAITKVLFGLFSINFFGLNTMRYQGFTEFKDNRLSSFSDSLKHVLNPNEYVLWDEPVINMADGVVVNTYNDALDMVAKQPMKARAIMFDYGRLDDMYGNNITIETPTGIRFRYFGLKRNSFLKYKLGDQVKAGQVLGLVGCSGKLCARPILHIECGYRFLKDVQSELPKNMSDIINQFKLNQFPIPALNFEAFYEMPLWTDYRDTQEGIERMYVKDIKYIFNPGHFMRAGSLIKKTSNK